MEHFFFYLGLAFLLIHEMDAIRCEEWKIIPGLSLLNDYWGYRIFIILHIPLFFMPLFILSDINLSKNLIFGLSVFFIIHFLLHLLFLKHRNNKFNDWFSWIIISLTGIFGLMNLIINKI